jgi:5-methylcytosine-specific restriction endonuclease McrA
MMASTYVLWAPRCALQGCNAKVSYHKKSGNKYKWKQFCSAHRGPLKAEVDNWKMSQGCSNKNAHHGFVCTSHITSPAQLDVNHIDGDRHNTSEKNLEILCKVCHQRVTIDNGHHTTRYHNQVDLDPELFEVAK